MLTARSHSRLLVIACLLLALGSLRASAAPRLDDSLGGDALGSLYRARGGKIVHLSSTDPTGGNTDFRAIAPGQTFTLADYYGAGIVRRWWIAISPYNNPLVQRQAILRCYWDGEATPSVECPVNDFFGMGFGERHDFVSMPVAVTSGGTACYWPMPFRRSARITLENRSNVPIDGFYYNLDIESRRSLPKDTLSFHAQFRRARTERSKPVTVLEATGRGQYVGTVLSMQAGRGRGLGYLEGDERVFVDGETKPSIEGTGTEDYFNGGWYFILGAATGLYSGCTLKDEAKGRMCVYRWHIQDAITFKRSLRFTMEHGGSYDAPGCDYCSVAYWYQAEPHAPFPPLPENLLPLDPLPVPKVPGIVEGESLLATAKATDGALSVQDLSSFEGEWSGLAHLFWQPKTIGARLKLPIPAPADGEYELTGYFTRASDYGILRVLANGQPLGSFDGYSAAVKASGPIPLGHATLHAGANEIELEITGRNERSSGYYVGFDGIVLRVR